MSEHPARGADLAHRYGSRTPGAPLRLKITVAVLGTGLLAWLAWAAYTAATPDVRTQVLSFRVLDDSRVAATVEVTADRDVAVACTLRAQDREHATAGLRRVVAPPGTHAQRVVRAVIKTRSRAVVVTVAGCRTQVGAPTVSGS